MARQGKTAKRAGASGKRAKAPAARASKRSGGASRAKPTKPSAKKVGAKVKPAKVKAVKPVKAKSPARKAPVKLVAAPPPKPQKAEPKIATVATPPLKQAPAPTTRPTGFVMPRPPVPPVVRPAAEPVPPRPVPRPETRPRTGEIRPSEKSPSEMPIYAGLTEADLLRMSSDDYMNGQQLAYFREMLLSMKQQLLENADVTSEHLRENDIVPDPADRATIEEEHTLELRTRDRERKLMRKIDESLARISDGSYGWCEETGEPIGLQRLLARPTATLSVEAQARRELKQKLYGE
jgi:DnaK suppressor protein